MQAASKNIIRHMKRNTAEEHEHLERQLLKSRLQEEKKKVCIIKHIKRNKAEEHGHLESQVF
jgi:hypothetical protein